METAIDPLMATVKSCAESLNQVARQNGLGSHAGRETLGCWWSEKPTGPKSARVRRDLMLVETTDKVLKWTGGAGADMICFCWTGVLCSGCP
jgi:hypothetical protein